MVSINLLPSPRFKRGEGKRFIDTVELNVEKVKGL
jgi:hypothetical protein